MSMLLTPLDMQYILNTNFQTNDQSRHNPMDFTESQIISVLPYADVEKQW